MKSTRMIRSTSVTNVELLEQLKDPGNARAWNELYALYQPKLMEYARACGLNRADSEELVQDCWLAIRKHIGRFEHDRRRGRFRAWLKAMVKHGVMNMRRKRRSIPLGGADFDVADRDGQRPDEILEKLLYEEDIRFCLRAIAREVDEKTFRAFVLHVLGEVPVPRVCRELGLTPNQVHQAKHRLTARLTRRMAALHGDTRGLPPRK